MAQRAIATLLWHGQPDLRRGGDVGRGRPMTDLATDTRMAVRVMRFDDIVMTLNTGLVPGIFDFECRDGIDRSSPVVTELPEGFRNKKVASDHQCNNK